MKAWLIWMAASLLLSFGIFAVSRSRKEKALALAGLSLLLGTAAGIICSKLFYYLTQINFMIANGWLDSLKDLSIESFSFFGGVAGVCLGVALSARLLGLKPMAALNDFAPAGLLLAAFARFGEIFLELVGTGPYLENEKLQFFPLAIPLDYGDGWVEWYLNVCTITAVVLLAVAVVSGFCFRKHRFLRSLFYLCLPQILLENLRNCSFYWFFCIRVEQLACMVAMAVILLIYAVRSRGEKRRFLSPVLALLSAGLFIVAEFAMEQKIEFLSFLRVEHCYAIMGVGTVLLLIAEITGFGRMERAVCPKN